MNKAVVCSRPDSVQLQRRRRDGIDNAALFHLSRRRASVFADRRRQLISLARQVGADLLPILPAVARLPQCVSGKEEKVRIDRREDYGLGADHTKVRRA